MKWKNREGDYIHRWYFFTWRPNETGPFDEYEKCRSLAVGTRWLFFYFHWHQGGNNKPYFRFRALWITVLSRWEINLLPEFLHYPV